MSVVARIGAVARVEALLLARSRLTFSLLLLVPALQVLLFGFAIRPTGDVAVAVAAAAPASAARVAAALRDRPGLRIVASGLRPGEAEALVRSGGATIGIELPPPRGFAGLLPPDPVRVVVDGSNAALVAAAVPAIEATYWREIAARQPGERGPGIDVTRLYNADGRADWTFLPALIGVTMMISAIMLGTLSLAREREGGTWETLLTLPLRPVEALVGKLLPLVVLGTLQGSLVLAAAVTIFGVPARGSVVTLIALLPLFAATHLVIGHAIAARAATQLAALQGAVAFYLPAMLLSGFLYPFEALPGWAQAIGSAFPLTHFIRAARGALLRGDDAATVAAHALPMLAVFAVALVIALLAQSRRLD